MNRFRIQHEGVRRVEMATERRDLHRACVLGVGAFDVIQLRVLRLLVRLFSDIAESRRNASKANDHLSFEQIDEVVRLFALNDSTVRGLLATLRRDGLCEETSGTHFVLRGLLSEPVVDDGPTMRKRRHCIAGM